MSEKSLQETYAAHSTCYGCGPSNPDGLKVRTMVDGDKTKAVWTPQLKYEAFPNVLNGGIIGSLLDCHCNWTAAWHLMKKAGVDHPPCTVTAKYSIELLRPTPTNGPVELSAWVKESTDDRATIEAVLTANGKPCAKCVGVFVAVKPGHPAYHRW